MTPIIWCEGIIAAGKSTFCREIAKRLDLQFIEEPVDRNFYLQAFYKDPKKYAFGMQVYLLHYRFAMKQVSSFSAALGQQKGFILDRCVAGDRVFAKMHWNAGNISDLDWQCYNYCYQVMARTIQPPTLLIYLDVQPETAYARMEKRSRKAETGVPLDYLRALKDGYEELLAEMERGLVPWSHSIKITRIIWDRETLTDAEWNAVAATISGALKRAETIHPTAL